MDCPDVIVSEPYEVENKKSAAIEPSTLERQLRDTTRYDLYRDIIMNIDYWPEPEE